MSIELIERTDLEIVTLCAETVGYTELDARVSDGYLWAKRDGVWVWYWPLDRLDQAMELLVKFNIDIGRDFVALWYPDYAKSDIPNLVSITTRAFETRWEMPRAICECVAEMQSDARRHAKRKASAKS